MRFILPILLLISLRNVIVAQTDTVSLKFKDFPVGRVFKGRPASVDLSSDKQARKYRTILRDGAKSGTNFAGHYTIVIWGCGTSCQQFAIVDAQTGKVHFSTELPYVSWGGLEENSGLQFRPDSRLLVVYGHRMGEDPAGVFFYEWDGNRLTLKKSILKN